MKLMGKFLAMRRKGEEVGGVKGGDEHGEIER
jgi:hypothetical protein